MILRTTPPPGPLTTSKTTHQDQYLYGVDLSWWGVVRIRLRHENSSLDVEVAHHPMKWAQYSYMYPDIYHDLWSLEASINPPAHLPWGGFMWGGATEPKSRVCVWGGGGGGGEGTVRVRVKRRRIESSYQYKISPGSNLKGPWHAHKTWLLTVCIMGLNIAKSLFV